MSDRQGDWFLLASGARFYPFDARPEDFRIRDIAPALSKVCRFAGHCREFYSVAQHSVLVCDLLPKPLKLYGLLHDATEAYINDLVRPVKYSLPQYVELEERLWSLIAAKWNLGVEMPPPVKDADNIALLMERRDIMPPCDYVWSVEKMGYTVPTEPIFPLTPPSAEAVFLRRYLELTYL
jgi:hypothetical protein